MDLIITKHAAWRFGLRIKGLNLTIGDMENSELFYPLQSELLDILEDVGAEPAPLNGEEIELNYGDIKYSIVIEGKMVRTVIRNDEDELERWKRQVRKQEMLKAKKYYK